MRLAALLLLGLAGCARVTVVPGTYPGDVTMWQRLVTNPEVLRVEGRPVAAIAPHHLIDGLSWRRSGRRWRQKARIRWWW